MISMRALSHILALLVALGAAVASGQRPIWASEAAPAAKAPLVFSARIVGDESRTRFVAEMTGAIDVSVFTLSDPYRIIVTSRR